MNTHVLNLLLATTVGGTFTSVIRLAPLAALLIHQFLVSCSIFVLMSKIDPCYYQMWNKLNAVVLAGGGSLQTTFRFDGFPFNME